jgi:crotonobetainyl-CoA:carnitine CoA-transferase CaiB-like acyl-CoA transferase
MMPLEGIRVLDLSRLAPGPFCTMLLGDLGADVLLVEAPPQALPGGGVRPEQAIDPEAGDRAAAYNALGRNKRSIILNLRHDEARRLFYRLAETADVVLEGFRPGVVKRLGVDYETIRGINPRIVYCSLSGYGQDGPYAQMVGHDINYISIAGALGMIGWPEQPPAIPLNVIADFAAGGLHAAYAILAALLARQRTGRGQHLDIAMSDGVMYLLTLAITQHLATGEVPRPGETLLNGGVPFYNVYQTKDGRWISVGSLEPHFFANLCRAMGREDFIPLQYDAARREEVFAYFRETFRTKTRDEWFQVLRETDICVAPVYSLDEALADPHNQHRGMVMEIEHPTLGKVRQVGIGTKLSDTPGAVRSPAPRPGQHTDQVLADLGYDAERIAALREAGAIG